MNSLRFAPELDSNTVNLTSIASLLAPKKRMDSKVSLEESKYNKSDIKNMESSASTAIKDQRQNHKSTIINCDSFNDGSDKQKRSAELAAVANNCALKNDYEAAISFYSKAIDLNANDFRFYCNRSLCYENMKKFENALKDAEKAIELNPYRPKPYFRKARAMLALKSYEEAEEAFKNVLKIDPNCEATINEMLNLRIITLREIGFDIDAALLAAKRCTSIAEAIDFVVNIELLSMKAEQKTTEKTDSKEQLMTRGSINDLKSDTTLADSECKILKTKRNMQSDDNSLFRKLNSRSSLHLLPHQNSLMLSKQTAKSIFQTKPHDGPTNLFGYKALWVGNVSPKTNTAMMHALFAKYGKVIFVKILKDKFCAFVNYDNPYAPRKAVANLYGTTVEGISNEWRPLKFRFVPSTEQPDSNRSHCTQIRSGNKECYFWRTTGCNVGDNCKLRHKSICKGIDFQPWMRR
ncbi:uncharacterized protein B4U79_04176 [Dinothrombium tinctorium]|uniref:Uncharacterized protein n=1 Tax=Dinothrombium tinctorium TaxID=1965070 RepID=A0A443QT74_9ACAR|nr:uncharacterized protein B4U79_04176 [Dinothrombium tinctorium]